MHTSQIRNSFTLSQKPSRIAGKVSFAICQSKNVAFTVAQPGDDTTTAPTTAKTATVRTVAQQDRAGVDRPSDPASLELPGAGLPVAHLRTGTSTTSESHSCSSLSIVPSSRRAASAVFTHGTSSLPFSNSRPNSSCSPVSGWN